MAENTEETKNVHELVSKVQEMLKEETWTRSTIESFTKNNLNSLADIVEQARREKVSVEVQDACDDLLLHTKDSLTALYISGMISLYDGALDNSALVSLVDIFKKNHKESLINYMCDKILEDEPNNKFALRTLAENCEDDSQKKWDLYAKVVKLDIEEADMAKALAEHAEKLAATEDDKDKSAKYQKEAISYYKKSLLRYISAKNSNAIKEVWAKLVALIPEEIDFFNLAKNKITKTISKDRAVDLMKDLYVWYKDNKQWDIAIDILKQNLAIDPEDKLARKELTECYSEKYAEKENVQGFIRQSFGLESRNVFESINDFEKHIAFDAGNYVYHRQWHVGKIKKVENDTLIINFGKKIGVKGISLKMAVQALTPLAKDHIWVLRATKKHDELVKIIKEDKTEALKIIIKSFNNNCDMKRIKSELVTTGANSILTPGEWTSWSSAAKKILASDPTFSVNPNDASFYTVRDRDLNQEEKLTNEFKAEKKFDERIKILMKYLENDECGINSDTFDPSSESLADMLSYFSSFLKAPLKIGENEIVSYLVLEHISVLNKEIPVQLKSTFADLYKRVEDPREIYKAIKSTSSKDDKKGISLRKNFLDKIRLLPNWADEYIKLFPVLPGKEILITLVENGKEDKVKKLIQDCFENYRANRSAVIYLFKECRKESWFPEEDVLPYEKQLIALVSIIEQNFREINNHVNTTENKKFNKNAADILFGDLKKQDKETGVLIAYILEKDEDTITRLYTLVNDITDLEAGYKQTLRKKILEKYPEFKFPTKEEKTTELHRGTFVTNKKLAEKKARLEEIQNVDLPAVGKELAEARAKGDLKENAEYDAAKQKRELLNEEQKKLQDEINRANVFDPTTINTSSVSFGTKVTLTDNLTQKEEVFTILGPWESAPEEGIISYMSPLASKFYGLQAGENIKFNIDESEYDYTIKSIEAAKF